MMLSLTRSLCCILLLLLAFYSEARQYKSRLFVDSNQALSEAGANTIAELENAFNTYNDDYQIATSGQFLARQMVANKEYEKAVTYYQKTLAAEALDPLIQNQLRLEFARLLIYLKQYEQVLTLVRHQEYSFEKRILLARAHSGLNQFHRAIEVLKPLLEQLSELPETALQQMAGISYGSGAISATIRILNEQLKRKPVDVALARQLTSLYLRQQDFEAALNLWSLTKHQGLLTEEQDWQLLADIYFQEGAPEKAARILQQGLDQTLISQSADNYYRLFQFWYAARESEKAKHSLWQSLQRNPDIEKAMMLAELLRQGEQWQELLQLLQYGCQEVLADKYVGKANLLLGISYHKLGRHNEARRALLNASLFSGEKESAREWLAFIQATPATPEESSKLEGLCLPADTHIALPKNIARKPTPEATSHKADADIAAAPAPLKIVTLPATKFYGNKIQTLPENLASELKKRTFSLMKNLLKSGGKISGRMHLLFDELQQGNRLKFVVAFPYSGVPANRGSSRIIREPELTVVARQFKGPVTELAAQWQSLVADALAQQLIPTGKARMVFLSDTSGTDQLDVSLQLEINH